MTAAPRTAVLFHLGLEQVASPAGEGFAGGSLVFSEGAVVGVVVVLHDLERPATLDDVAPDELRVEPVGNRVVSSLTEGLDGLTEGQIGLSGEPVEAVEQTSGVLDRFERLRKLPERSHGGVVETLRTQVRGVGVVM